VSASSDWVRDSVIGGHSAGGYSFFTLCDFGWASVHGSNFQTRVQAVLTQDVHIFFVPGFGGLRAWVIEEQVVQQRNNFFSKEGKGERKQANTKLVLNKGDPFVGGDFWRYTDMLHPHYRLAAFMGCTECEIVIQNTVVPTVMREESIQTCEKIETKEEKKIDSSSSSSTTTTTTTTTTTSSSSGSSGSSGSSSSGSGERESCGANDGDGKKHTGFEWRDVASSEIPTSTTGVAPGVKPPSWLKPQQGAGKKWNQINTEFNAHRSVWSYFTATTAPTDREHPPPQPTSFPRVNRLLKRRHAIPSTLLPADRETQSGRRHRLTDEHVEPI